MKPWSSGPTELLRHALGHFENGSPFDNRIAFISIDNAVELIAKTYLGLPKRVRKTNGPPRKRLQEASYSFPDLLDLLEEYGSAELEGIDLGDIEWYHRLRNTLYHEGSGVTVDPEKVDGYFQIARILLKNLLEEDLHPEVELEPKSPVGEIVLRSSQLEHNIRVLYQKHFPAEDPSAIPMMTAIARLADKGVVSEEIVDKLQKTTAVRNEAVHSPGNIDTQKVKKAAETLWEITKIITHIMA